MILKKNTAKSKRVKYGKHELDAVRKFSYETWLFLAKPLNILHLCMGGDIHKINTNWILLTGPDKNIFSKFRRNPMRVNIAFIIVEFREIGGSV
jgi:hypothetical protein